MRWGVPDDCTDKHTTVSRCMKEIFGCKKYSIGPNFVVRRKKSVTVVINYYIVIVQYKRQFVGLRTTIALLLFSCDKYTAHVCVP